MPISETRNNFFSFSHELGVRLNCGVAAGQNVHSVKLFHSFHGGYRSSTSEGNFFLDFFQLLKNFFFLIFYLLWVQSGGRSFVGMFRNDLRIYCRGGEQCKNNLSEKVLWSVLEGRLYCSYFWGKQLPYL